MASQEEATQASDLTFPAANVDKDLSVQNNKSLEVDPKSSEVATSLEIEQQAEVEQKGKEKKKKDALQTLKTTILVSAVIVAVAGVVFAVTKKLREK
ncbi:uncharacterized protein LOC126692151 [Quercus robur]|uniref:Transmembrane protein n=1 Tax=Quercus lobata TaxID=97700 RepID=A0A7N2M696_QUELO|nr:uncharacterized protein LOC115954096 [Quercus lobata]XP_050243609.1 uncharacterized protein LOC126692151 [Quercus robur]